MKTTAKLALAGAAVVGIGLVILARSKQPAPLSPEREAEMMKGIDEAELAAPPGWDFCHEPSYYIRACETGPYTQRWSGPAPGTCPVIAICGAHTKPCGGEQGATLAMMDQGGTRYYPIPEPSSGEGIRDAWRLCYEQKQNIWGAAYPCASAPLPGGVQTISFKTWDQLPEGAQKIAWGKKYGCGPYAPTATVGTPAPALTVTPIVPPACPTCPPVLATPTITPHIGPALTRTWTPHIGPAPSRTHTNIPVPVTRTPA